MKADGYFKGNAYRLTGKKETHYDGKFLEAELMEGIFAGETVLIPEYKHKKG